MSLHRPVLIVVGDKARTRLFDNATADASLQEVDDLFNPDLRHHERDLGSDRPGRSVNGGGRHTALGADYAKRRIRAARFAEAVAERVHGQLRVQKYARIFVVAGPEFTGLLGPCLVSRSAQPPVTRVIKDLTRHSVEDIRKHLPQRLR